MNADKCPEEPDNEDMTWEYKGDGGLLVARSYTACEASCDPDYSKTYDADVVLWTIGAGGVKKLLSAKNDTKLLDVDAGRILLRDPAGSLLVLNSAGKQVKSLPVSAKSARLDGATRVSAMTSETTLTTYDIASGKVVETCT